MACWSLALTVEIHFEILLPLAEASLAEAITAQSAPIAVVRLQVVKLGAATRRVSLRPWSICQSFPQASGCAGGWLAIRVAPMRAGVLTPSILLVAHRLRVRRRHNRLGQRPHHVHCRPPRRALTVRPRLLRHLARVRDGPMTQKRGKVSTSLMRFE